VTAVTVVQTTECLSAKKERRKTSGLTAVTVVQITGWTVVSWDHTGGVLSEKG